MFEHISPVGHKLLYGVYGDLFKTENDWFFVREKFTRINENKPSPKIISNEIFVSKKIENIEKFFEDFKKIDEKEKSNRWGYNLANI